MNTQTLEAFNMYDWDERKSELNRQRRGFGFEIIRSFIWEYALCTEVQYVDFEEREQWIGPVDDKLYVLVITHREPNVRVISMRQATQSEINFWRREVSNG